MQNWQVSNLLCLLLCCVLFSACDSKQAEKTPPHKATKPESAKKTKPVDTEQIVKNKPKKRKVMPVPEFSEEDIAEGERLSKIYCNTCHLYPEPDWLDQTTWYNFVLPNMSIRLGRFSINGTSWDYIPDEWFEAGEGGEKVRREKVFPSEPVVNKKQWHQIVAYYSSQAPKEALPIENPLNIQTFYFPFKVHKPDVKGKLSPTVTFVDFRKNSDDIFVGEASVNNLKIFKPNGELVAKAAFNGPPVQTLEISPSSFIVTAIGSIPATDLYTGEIVLLNQNPETKALKQRLVMDKLGRPVHTSITDLNNDKQSDLIISSFGNWTGNFSWYSKDKNSPKFEQHKLNDTPGSTFNAVYDFNRDGKQDIILLKAHGDEGIYLYTNEGDGKFTESKLVRFPPSYGSNYMELVDFNKDGYIDILTTNGDNADFPPILKRYHGVRLFINQKDGTLKEEHFFPLYGAIKAKAFDYDNDGDLDIAAIAFFPNFEESLKATFVLLDNHQENGFRAYSFKGAGASRWMAMDTGDFDKDGDQDIVLGAHNMEADLPDELLLKWRKEPVPLMILENLTVK